MTSPLEKLGLGSAQFPLDEAPGASRGRSPAEQVKDILQIAARAGLGVFDVAGRAPQNESILGQLMPRPVPFRIAISTVRADKGPDIVELELIASLRRLGVETCETVLVPSASDLFGDHGAALWTRLQRLKDQGLFKKIGITAFASDDPVGLARRFRPDIVQAPASLLDQRLLVNGALAEIAGLGIEVHLRSIFLNGLLFLPPDRVPSQLKGAAGRISRARRMIAEGRSDPLQAALGFALSRPEAHAVLVGVTSPGELSAVIAAASSPPPDLDWDEMALDDPSVIDSRTWAAA
ncbi:MAG TPA: bifunctional regulator KidO [Phenylobacterium sp.]